MTAGDVDRGSGVATWWTVTVTAAGAKPLAEVDERLVDLVEALEEHSAVGISEPSRYGTRFSVQAQSPGTAVEVACRLFQEAAERAGLPAWPVVQASAATEAEVELSWQPRTTPGSWGWLRWPERWARAASASPPWPASRTAFHLRLPSWPPVPSAATLHRFVEEWDRRPGRRARATGMK